jgi:hypothetical protein
MSLTRVSAATRPTLRGGRARPAGRPGRRRSFADKALAGRRLCWDPAAHRRLVRGDHRTRAPPTCSAWPQAAGGSKPFTTEFESTDPVSWVQPVTARTEGSARGLDETPHVAGSHLPEHLHEHHPSTRETSEQGDDNGRRDPIQSPATFSDQRGPPATSPASRTP